MISRNFQNATPVHASQRSHTASLLIISSVVTPPGTSRLKIQFPKDQNAIPDTSCIHPRHVIRMPFDWKSGLPIALVLGWTGFWAFRGLDRIQLILSEAFPAHARQQMEKHVVWWKVCGIQERWRKPLCVEMNWGGRIDRWLQDRTHYRDF
jgi:hypothetical protein